ncbi:phosphoesterase [Streptomyces sp. DSM 42041]|uniref:Phosphoesterase n=1 Tax=Streptomyces hazeniae TaxID=3075538 RepID=A0ABU2NMX5_9ACTN|nr:phosphoesterase [Streptomyces sp. DSM 42041]MDT0378115.1 phosphoesterase [Streptomyces sp. DSM 42041]
MRNGDAEQGPGGTDAPVDAVTGWKVTEGAPALIRYDFGEGHPGPKDPGPPRRGSRFFAGGTSPRTTLLQDVALPTDGATGRGAVDAGGVRFRAAAWLGGFGDQEDGARLSVEFRDGRGTPVALAVLGPLTATERDGRTGMFERTAEAAVPPGARSVRLVLALTQDGGAANDGYADALSLTLHGGSARVPSATPTTAPARREGVA